MDAKERDTCFFLFETKIHRSLLFGASGNDHVTPFATPSAKSPKSLRVETQTYVKSFDFLFKHKFENSSKKSLMLGEQGLTTNEEYEGNRNTKFEPHSGGTIPIQINGHEGLYLENINFLQEPVFQGSQFHASLVPGRHLAHVV